MQVWFPGPYSSSSTMANPIFHKFWNTHTSNFIEREIDTYVYSFMLTGEPAVNYGNYTMLSLEMVSSNRSKMANYTNFQGFQNHPQWTAAWEVWHCMSNTTTTKTTTRISKLLFFDRQFITVLPRAQSCFTNVFKVREVREHVQKFIQPMQCPFTSEVPD